MFRKALIGILGAAFAIAVLAVAPQARADQFDQSARLTFGQSIQLPGNQILPAGTYWFAVRSDFSNSSDIVQISNVDHSKVMGTYITNAIVRRIRTDKVELKFAEPSTGQAPALLSWYYPGDTFGHQFVYPSNEEAQISASVHITVDARNAS